MLAAMPQPPLSALPALHDFWQRLQRQAVTDRSLTALTLLLLAEVVVMPPLIELGFVNRHVADLVFLGGLALGVWILADHTAPGRLFIATAFASGVLRLANVWLPDADLRGADAAFAAVNALALGWLTLAYTLAAGRINVHRVLGSIAAYLLVGIAFTQAHRLVAILADPGAYLVLGRPAAYSDLVPKLGYYSFVTLTSLGYGDITPAHPAARSLAVLQALVGVLYPTALLGWLVSLATRDPSRRD